MTAEEYSRFTQPHERLLKRLELRLSFHIEDIPGLAVHSVHRRIKTYQSAAAKSQEKRIPIEEMHDVAGLRVVTYSRQDADMIARLFTYLVDVKDAELIKDEYVSHSTGYRSRHQVLKFSGKYTSFPFDALIEIQIPTIIENAYNSISRRWLYKGACASSQAWKKDFRKASKLLAEIDDLVAKLDESATKSSLAEANTPITAGVYQELAREYFGVEVEASVVIDEVVFLSRLGCSTVGDLRTFFSRPDVPKLQSAFKELAQQGNEAAHHFANMDAHSFHTFYGVRMEAGKNLLNVLKQQTKID